MTSGEAGHYCLSPSLAQTTLHKGRTEALPRVRTMTSERNELFQFLDMQNRIINKIIMIDTNEMFRIRRFEHATKCKPHLLDETLVGDGFQVVLRRSALVRRRSVTEQVGMWRQTS